MNCELLVLWGSAWRGKKVLWKLPDHSWPFRDEQRIEDKGFITEKDSMRWPFPLAVTYRSSQIDDQKKLLSHETVKELSCYGVTSGTSVCKAEH